MVDKKQVLRMALIGPIVAAMLGAGALVAHGSSAAPGEGPASGSETLRESGRESGGEHGAGGEGREGGGECPSEGEVRESGGESGGEIDEAAMSSPITPLDQRWSGALGGLAVSAWYDPATQSVNSLVRNTTSQVLCYVQAEPHLKSGARTVGELGPDVLGHLGPGEEAVTSVSVADEPGLAGVAFDGYVVHLEVFDCAGPGPQPHSGAEGAEGSGGSEEGGAAMLAPGETFDMVRGGVRLILGYDPVSNAFEGSVRNTTDNVLTRVRIEVHLDNGTELGPTTPIDLGPREMSPISLPSTQAPFSGWIAHAEVGGGEAGGGEAGGEHGAGSGGGEGRESGRGESGGEHGGRGEGSRGR